MNSIINETSMRIILHAGDAQFLLFESLDAIKDSNYELAGEKLSKATEEITKGHRAQTEVLQIEANEESMEYSVLFAHAQDTLMTVKMSLELIKKMTGIFERIDDRIEVL